MKKSITTRFKKTKKKVLSRKKGQCHFKVNKSSAQLKRRKNMKTHSGALEKIVNKNPEKL